MNQECITTCQYVKSNRNYFKTLSIQQPEVHEVFLIPSLQLSCHLKHQFVKSGVRGPGWSWSWGQIIRTTSLWLVTLAPSANHWRKIVCCLLERGRIKAISASGQLLSPLARIIYWCYRLPPLQFQASWISQPMPCTSTSVTWMRLLICIIHLNFCFKRWHDALMINNDVQVQNASTLVCVCDSRPGP